MEHLYVWALLTFSRYAAYCSSCRLPGTMKISSPPLNATNLVNTTNLVNATNLVNTKDVQEFLRINKNNATALKELKVAGWTNAPEFRGTSNILWSCILTIVACVWTALHPNLQARNKGVSMSASAIATRCASCMIALLCPEMSVYIASVQWMKARWLRRELNKELDKTRAEDQDSTHGETSSSRQIRHKFSMKYCFFVVMGGMQVSVKEVRTRGCHTALGVFSAEGVLQLARLGYYHHVSDEALDERSQADLVQKLLALCQILWMAIQIGVRVGTGLQLTLLEIHTALHVACAAITYVFWLNVSSPFLSFDPQLPGIADLKKTKLETVQRSKARSHSPSELYYTKFYRVYARTKRARSQWY